MRNSLKINSCIIVIKLQLGRLKVVQLKDYIMRIFLRFPYLFLRFLYKKKLCVFWTHLLSWKRSWKRSWKQDVNSTNTIATNFSRLINWGGGGRVDKTPFLRNLCDKYCPNGLAYKALGEICNFNRGQSLTKQSANVGNIPVISGGMKPAFYTNIANRDACSITVAGSGANAGYIWWHQDPIFCADSFTVDIKSEYKMSFNLKYIYYYLKCKERSIIDSKPQGGVPHVHGKDIKNFSVPVPPLPVQEEIVRILDRFDALVNDISVGLPAELSTRRQQYEYYRNRLLTFERAR